MVLIIQLSTSISKLSTINDILASIKPGSKFYKIDLRYAYQQLLLNKKSQDLTVITTHMGNFRYRKLPYGINIGPAKFQRIMETLLAGIKGVFVFYDDFLIMADSEEVHLHILEEVKRCLSEVGLKINLDKCEFGVSEVNYLGYLINSEGIRPSKIRVKAIIDQKKPSNIRQVKSFVGMVNHYSKFVPFRAEILKPLYNVAKSNSFYWNHDCDKSFEEIKKQLAANSLLVHVDEKLDLFITL